MSMADIMEGIKGQGAEHLFEGLKAARAACRQPQDYFNFAEKFPELEIANVVA